MPCVDREARSRRGRRPGAGGRTRGSTPDPRRRHRRSADSGSSGRPRRLRTVVDERSATARTEARSHQQRGAAGADRATPATETSGSLQECVDLTHSGLDRDELGTPLDDERLVEVVAAIHLEREPAELAEPLLTEDEQRPALAAEIARGRSGRLAGEERHGERIAGGSAAARTPDRSPAGFRQRVPRDR